MKKINLMVLAFFYLAITISCKKEKDKTDPEPEPNGKVTAEKTNVQTYEIINLVVQENLAPKYNATFGAVNIELIKTSDSTLTFYIPDVPAGETKLKFELSTIAFTVAKTPEVNASQLVADLMNNLDLQVAALNVSTPGEIADIDSFKKYKSEVLALFNQLTDAEKRQTALFYGANKEIFRSFSTNTFSNLDAPTTLKKQSSCPKTDFKTYYGCTAENLGNAAIGLKNSSQEFLKMMGLAGVMAGVAYNTSVLGPVAWGITAVGISLPLGTAGYLLITEVIPAALHFKQSLYPFLEANWIFSKALFVSTVEVFKDGISTSLNLKPAFRSITADDGDVNPGSGYFINAMAALSEYWNRLSSIFGSFPAFKNNEAPTTLSTNNITISNISNPKVQYVSHTAQEVKFKLVAGTEETFSYNIRVTKEGFVEEKTLHGKVMALADSTEIYKAAALGWWTVNHYDPNNPSTSYQVELFANGTGTYHIPNNSTTYPTNWYISKVGNEYRLFEYGFWHPAYNTLSRDKLLYPVTTFKVYANFDPNFVSQVYIKN
jgi:hypothetical protein